MRGSILSELVANPEYQNVPGSIQSMQDRNKKAAEADWRLKKRSCPPFDLAVVQRDNGPRVVATMKAVSEIWSGGASKPQATANVS
jgi:hypothetical protein